MKQNNYVTKIKELRTISGCGIIECSKTLNIFDSINQSYEYLRMRNLAVCRRKSDGTQWKDQDYIDWIRENIE